MAGIAFCSRTMRVDALKSLRLLVGPNAAVKGKYAPLRGGRRGLDHHEGGTVASHKNLITALKLITAGRFSGRSMKPLIAADRPGQMHIKACRLAAGPTRFRIGKRRRRCTDRLRRCSRPSLEGESGASVKKAGILAVMKAT